MLGPQAGTQQARRGSGLTAAVNGRTHAAAAWSTTSIYPATRPTLIGTMMGAAQASFRAHEDRER